MKNLLENNIRMMVVYINHILMIGVNTYMYNVRN